MRCLVKKEYPFSKMKRKKMMIKRGMSFPRLFLRGATEEEEEEEGRALGRKRKKKGGHEKKEKEKKKEREREMRGVGMGKEHGSRS